MPQFIYIAKDLDGKTKSEKVEALDEQVLAEKLQGQGLFIVSIKQVGSNEPANKTKSPNTLPSTIKYTHKSVKLDDLVIFSRQLATMLEAGVNLMRSLTIISSQISSQRLAETVIEVRNDVEQGKSLSAALAKHKAIFNQFWISLAEVGEASGTMPAVLNKIASHMQQQAAFRNTVVSALIYPAILFSVCIGAILFFAMVVAPKFEDIFHSMGAKLPPITAALLTIFKFIKKNFVFIAASIAGAIFAFNTWKKTHAGKLAYEQFLFKLPVVGEITRLILVERFTAQMSILTDSGVPILNALEITERMMENLIAESVVNNIREEIRNGKPFAESMDSQNFFPSMAVQMVKVGEETGELGKMFKHVAVFYQTKVEDFMKRFGTIIEPFMLVFMAGAIGIIVIAIFMPLFKMGQAS